MHKITHTEAPVKLDNIPIPRTACKHKKEEDVTYSTHRVQGRFRVCYTCRSTTYFSLFKDKDGEHILCNPRSGINVFEEHNEL